LPQDTTTSVLYGSTDDAFLALSGGEVASTPLALGSAGLTVALTFQLPSAFPTVVTSMRLFSIGFSAGSVMFGLSMSVSSTGALSASWANVLLPSSPGPPLYMVTFFPPSMASSECAVAWGAWSTVALTVDASGIASLYASGNQSALATSTGVCTARVAVACHTVASAVCECSSVVLLLRLTLAQGF
jgi:hypothetical protein